MGVVLAVVGAIAALLTGVSLAVKCLCCSTQNKHEETSNHVSFLNNINCCMFSPKQKQ